MTPQANRTNTPSLITPHHHYNTTTTSNINNINNNNNNNRPRHHFPLQQPRKASTHRRKDEVPAMRGRRPVQRDGSRHPRQAHATRKVYEVT